MKHARPLALLLAAALLAACALGAGPEPTPAPAPIPTAAVAPPTAAPPTAAAQAPTAAAPTATAATTEAAQPTSPPPTAEPAPLRPQTRLGTFFFYWYDCPRHECDAAQLSAVPPGWVAPLPNDRDPRDGTFYSSQNEDWYEGELRDMRSVGIQTIFPVSWGEHPHYWFTNETLRTLVQANAVQPRPLEIGMFLDTTAQQAMYSDFHDKGYHFGPGVGQMPLTDPMSGYFFYERHIKGFFDEIPREMWATEQGRPIIVAYTAICCRDLQRAGALWAAVKGAFERDFGVQPWLILEDTWFAPEAVSPPAGMRPLGEVADGRYSWGSALRGPQTRTINDYTVSSAGPGFDNRRITGVADPQLQPRASAPDGTAGDAAAFFRASLAAVPPEADLLLIETWNEWPESTGIARATYPSINGAITPDDLYLRVLREWRFGT
jgi:hypothetical protein